MACLDRACFLYVVGLLLGLAMAVLWVLPVCAQSTLSQTTNPEDRKLPTFKELVQDEVTQNPVDSGVTGNALPRAGQPLNAQVATRPQQSGIQRGIQGPVAPAQPAGQADAFLRLQQEFVKKKNVWTPSVKADDFDVLLFTAWQRTLVRDALDRFEAGPPEEDKDAMPDADGVVRGPAINVQEVEELADIEEEPAKARKKKVAPGIRELQLGGIMYNTSKDWTIWLNGYRVTPNAWPERVIDLDVFDDYIELIWFDEYTSLVYPIRLRPHQRFNLDRRIYLPGTRSN